MNLKVEVRFANPVTSHGRMDFSLTRYLVQRFPPLAASVEDAASDRWSYNAPLLQEMGEAKAFMHHLEWEVAEPANGERYDYAFGPPEHQRPGPDPVDLDDHAAIADALGKLDEWIVSTLKDLLPNSAVDALAKWLATQWRPYWPIEPFPDESFWRDYFWRYIRLLEVPSIKIRDRAFIAPALAGSVEVHPVRVSGPYGNDDDPICDYRWQDIHLREQTYTYTPASLCDSLRSSFARRENGCLITGDYKDCALYLVVRYRGPTLATAYLQRGEAFWFTFMNLHPSDHWALRESVTRRAQAQDVFTRALPTCFRIALKEKHPHVMRLLDHAAAHAADAEACLADPFWLDRAVLERTTEEAYKTVADQGPRGNLAEWVLLDKLGSGFIQSEQVVGTSQGTNDARRLPVECWAEAALLPQDLAESKARLDLVRQRELASRHRELVEILEELIRSLPTTTFPVPGMVPCDLDPLFCSFVALWEEAASRNLPNRPDILITERNKYTHRSSTPFYTNVLKPWLGKPVDSVENLNVMLQRAIPQNRGTRLRTLLDASESNPPSLLVFCDGTEEAFADLLLAGKIIVQIRNLLEHSNAVPSQLVRPDLFLISNPQMVKHQIELTPDTLASVFRLVAAVVAAALRYSALPKDEFNALAVP